MAVHTFALKQLPGRSRSYVNLDSSKISEIKKIDDTYVKVVHDDKEYTVEIEYDRLWSWMEQNESQRKTDG